MRSEPVSKFGTAQCARGAFPNRLSAALILALSLVLAACSGGGKSEPLANGAADAGSGVAEVYDANGAKLPNGGENAGRTVATSTIGNDSVNNGAPPASDNAPAAAGGPVLTDKQVNEQYTPAFDACMGAGDAAKGVTVAMADCIAAELKVQDDRLNAAYKSAMEKRDEAGRTALRDEERAWIKRRDATCQALAQGGSIDAIQIPSCVLDETIRRRVALQPMAG